MKLFAKQYIEVLNDIDQRLSQVRTHVLTYEDLMSQPGEELSKICKFLGVDSGQETITGILETASRGVRIYYEGIESEPVTSWQTMLKKRHISWINRVYGARKQKVCRRLLQPT